MESSLVCSFSSFLPDKSKCTTSPYFPNENSLVYVKNCRRNIKNHLKSCNIGDIASEGHLICYRAGVFFAIWGLYHLSISSILPWDTMEEEVILLTPESQYNGKGRGWEEHNFVYVSAPSYSIWIYCPYWLRLVQ